MFGWGKKTLTLYVNAPTYGELTCVIFVSYIMKFQRIMMYKTPPGGERGL